jgi:phosphate-selective porin OprO/OprP
MKTPQHITILFLILILGTSLNAQDEGFKVKWDNGFKFESPDGNFKLKFGGRLMYDFAFMGQDDDLENANGEIASTAAEFRRIRFYNSGTVYSNVKYKVQLDFAGGKISAKDVFLEITKIPGLGNIRIGHFKEPFRLEALTSSKYITFMERAFPASFSPERNTGIMVHNKALDSQLFWQLGFFKNGDSAGDDENENSGLNITARVAGLLLNDTESHQLLHVGAAVSSRNPIDDEYSISLRPDAHMAPKYVETGDITDVDNLTMFGLEAALVMGSFSLQGEYVSQNVKLNGGDSYTFPTFYGFASFFLTGEYRRYKDGYACFDRVKPKNNFGEGGSGAWELALRYSSADFTDQNVFGGKMNDITLGLNWYLNPVTRIMANLVLADIDNTDEDDVGKATIFQTRFQLDF